MNNTLQERFESKYIPEPMTGCFLWFGATHRQGYGQMMVDGKPCLAHRIAWGLYRAPVPENMNVLHRCDTPSCVNVDHLFLGTQSDNMMDCYKKRRASRKGILNGNVKLTEEAVRDIRSAKRRPRVLYDLAAKYGVARATVANVRLGRPWRGV